jgi:hypothetical protein
MAASEHAQAHNQLLFREVNRRTAALSHAEVDATTVSFLCECSDACCTQTVRLSVIEYQELRTSPRRFLVAPEHESGGRVVRRSPRYSVVERPPAGGHESDSFETAELRQTAA